MDTISAASLPQVAENEWITFPGGELEGKRPKALCPDCREKARRARGGAPLPSAGSPERAAPDEGAAQRSQLRAPLCFACYRTEFTRERAFKAAAEIDTASEVRFQSALPFEPVNHARLERLRVERAGVRIANQAGAGRYADKRRHAQIAARHALQHIAAGLHARNAAAADRERALAAAIHAAELQLPDAWLPFVLCR
jgi:hypothetical protein